MDINIELYQNKLLVFKSTLDEVQLKDLKDYIKTLNQQKIPKDNAEARVCQYYEVTPEQLRSPKHTREIAEARRMIWRKLVTVHGWTYEKAGAEYNKKHAAVIEGVRLIAETPGLLTRYNSIFR